MNTSTKIETKGYTNDQKYIWKKCKFIFMGKIERDKKIRNLPKYSLLSRGNMLR